jgi:uncharacterized delta-60 repeat protein
MGLRSSHTPFRAVASCAATLAAALAVGASAGAAQAVVPGEFDSSFGTGGVSINQFSPPTKPISLATDVVDAPEGKVVAAGAVYDTEGNQEVGVARYLSNGQLDPTFGAGGAVGIQFGQGPKPRSLALYSALAVLPDGRIVIAGQASKEEHEAAFIARLTASGGLDPSFSGGKVVQQLGLGASPSSTFYGLYQQPDGKVVVTGSATGAEGHEEFVAERFSSTGSPDGTFGTGGVFRRQFGVKEKEASLGADVIPIGSEYAFAGRATDSKETTAFLLVKLTAGGALNLGFGSGGATVQQVSEHPTNRSVSIRLVQQSTGKIVLGGYAPADAENHPAFALARFTSAGILDPTFGTNGVTLSQVSPSPSPSSEGVGPIVMHDDRLLMPGLVYYNEASLAVFTVARYTPDGALDPSFAEHGVLQRQLGSGLTAESLSLGGSIDSAGRLLVAGAAGISGENAGWLVARIFLEPPAVPCGLGCPAPPPPPPAPPTPLRVSLAGGGTLTMDKHGNVVVKVSSSLGGTGSLTLTSVAAFKASVAAHHKAKPLRLGSARFTLVAGRTVNVKVHLSKRAQALIRRLGKLRSKLAVAASASGQTTHLNSRVTIKPAKRKAKHH